MLPEILAVGEEGRAYGPLSIVVSRPPGLRVWLPMTYWDAESAVYVNPSIVKIGPFSGYEPVIRLETQ